MALFSDIFGNKRADALKSLAYDLDMEYSRKDEFKFIKRMGEFQLFKAGHSKRIRNILRKDDDWLEFSTAIFDYQYTIQHGKSSSTYVQTVFFVDSKKLALPQFLLKPENFFHRIGKSLNWVKDIEFEEHPEFSRKYLIQSEFPEMFKEKVDEDFTRFFSVENKWRLEGVNYFLIFYRLHKKLPVSQIKDFYSKGLRLVEMLQDEDTQESSS